MYTNMLYKRARKNKKYNFVLYQFAGISRDFSMSGHSRIGWASVAVVSFVTSVAVVSFVTPPQDGHRCSGSPSWR
ncbi:hypothetical protein CJ030_MR6G000781 [Morella rubra]|uniref:Uncharacterized protein n=1 Tax=Morella rubra TaxID=262757 RepID=A0A6A1V8Z1_9ROSI|nr:hypothetical protein CJ030_MR6G000781 [Morella rubra]